MSYIALFFILSVICKLKCGTLGLSKLQHSYTVGRKPPE